MILELTIVHNPQCVSTYQIADGNRWLDKSDGKEFKCPYWNKSYFHTINFNVIKWRKWNEYTIKNSGTTYVYRRLTGDEEKNSPLYVAPSTTETIVLEFTKTRLDTLYAVVWKQDGIRYVKGYNNLHSAQDFCRRLVKKHINAFVLK